MIDGKPRYARESDLGLGAALRLWLRELQPKFLLLHCLAWIVFRVWLLGHGDYGWRDLIPIVAIVTLHPLAEWVIHVFILHHRPRTILGLRWDYHAAHMHRVHHRDPWDLRFVLMPLPIMFLGMLLAAVVFKFVTSSPGVWASAMVTTSAIACYSEWIHFLTHTAYRPKGRVYERQWRLHRLHHFKNEHYWMGVTRHAGDWLLGTMRDPKDVETSKTARTLGEDA